MVGRSAVIAAIEEDFQCRLPGYHKSRREGLTTLAGVMLEVRSGNLMELAAAPPREIGAAEHRYQYIERQLANPEACSYLCVARLYKPARSGAIAASDCMRACSAPLTAPSAVNIHRPRQ